MLITELNKNGTIARGMRSAEVKRVQQLLIEAGEDLGRWKDDGNFGPKTEEAVKGFQTKKKIQVDGRVGSETLYELMFYAYKNFRKEEFRCKCNGQFCNGYHTRVDENLLVLLQKIRDHFGSPVNINSGLRCFPYNRTPRIGSTDKSQHPQGRAADIVISGVSPSTVYAYADKINPNGGVGSYRTFTHVDTRKGRSRW
jgi:peptidoglycan hydrolase-like protein with peptidoglycan-binding domain